MEDLRIERIFLLLFQAVIMFTLGRLDICKTCFICLAKCILLLLYDRIKGMGVDFTPA